MLKPAYEWCENIKKTEEEWRKCQALCDDIKRRCNYLQNVEVKIYNAFTYLRPFTNKTKEIQLSGYTLCVSRSHIHYLIPPSRRRMRVYPGLFAEFIRREEIDRILPVIRSEIREDFASLISKARKVLDLSSRKFKIEAVRRGDFIIPDPSPSYIGIDHVNTIKIDAESVDFIFVEPQLSTSTFMNIGDRARLFHLYPTIYEMLLELRDKVYAETEEIAKTFKEMEDIISPYLLKRKIE